MIDSRKIFKAGHVQKVSVNLLIVRTLPSVWYFAQVRYLIKVLVVQIYKT